MRNVFMFVLPVLAFFTAAVVSAADYTVDKDHSHVGFMVRHMVSKVPGSFKEFEGSFKFDEKAPDKSSVDFTAKADSISTDNEKRDKHLKSEDFLDADKFKTLTFKSGKVSKSGKNKFKVAGDLTIHGVTKPVTFTVDYLGAAKDPWGNMRAGFTANTTINRKDYGIVWNKTLDGGGLMVSDDVVIDVQIEGIVKK